jgi:hypothetical protein
MTMTMTMVLRWLCVLGVTLHRMMPGSVVGLIMVGLRVRWSCRLMNDPHGTTTTTTTTTGSTTSTNPVRIGIFHRQCRLEDL